ncbi:MAG: branched-chain amino acid ABC transporter permease [Candidatus Borkfalkiaceae bacterium]|nr:branched-chain amino acid ABC transporter permease [Clostridia bacterium]MDY6224172.1 branched-chain amino acid ABC transporter permease [Christensenellaceae bacterium]
MIKVLTTLINGLSLGGVYALIALGYTMVYGIAKMLNFAHGDIIMVGSYTILIFFNMIGIPLVGLIASTLISVLVCVVFGIVIERTAYRPLRGASPLAVLITAIGVSYLLQSIAQIVFGTAPRTVILNFMGTITIGALKINVATIVTLAVAIAVMAALTLFVNKTRTGRAMLAVSEDRGAAQLAGVSVNTIIAVTFAIGSALAAIAGAFTVMKTYTVEPTMGAMPGIKAFTAAVIGGIGSIPGAMAGGILLGVIETACDAVPVLSPYKIAIEFALLIIVLLIKPTGILGKKKREKV